MSPYRENALPLANKPKAWGFKIWFCCHVLNRHVESACLIKCSLDACNHVRCIYCRHMDRMVHLPENEPHRNDLIGQLIWARGCFHDWRSPPFETIAVAHRTQQCANCRDQRPKRFPVRRPDE